MQLRSGGTVKLDVSVDLFTLDDDDMSFVMRLCNPVHVFDQGAQIFTGTPEEVQTNPAVLDAYLGA